MQPDNYAFLTQGQKDALGSGTSSTTPNQTSSTTQNATQGTTQGANPYAGIQSALQQATQQAAQIQQGINAIKPPSTTINGATLNSSGTGLQYPAPTSNANSSSSFIQSLQSMFNTQNQTISDMQNAATPAQSTQNSLVAALKGLYDKFVPQAQTLTNLQQQAGIPDMQKKLADLNTTIAQKTADFNNLNAQIESQAAGRGITTTEVIGQQAAINRQKAVEIGGLASVAQALQGNLNAAESLAEKTAQIEFEDQKAQIDQQLQLISLNADQLTREEKAKADKVQIYLNQQKTLLDAAQTERNNIIQTAMTAATKGNAPADVYQKILNAGSYSEALQIAAPYMSDPYAAQKAAAEIAKTKADTALTYANIAKTNAETSQTTSGSSVKDNQALSTINDVQNVLSDPSFNNVFGITGMFSTLVPGSAAQLAKANVQKVINSLALAARGQLKGQGQISDFEGKMLKEAQTSLNFNLSAEQARKELAKVRGALATSSGLKATVKITDPKTGQSQNVQADSNGIMTAIRDGLQVEYQ